MGKKYAFHDDLKRASNLRLGNVKITPFLLRVINGATALSCAFFWTGRDLKKSRKVLDGYAGGKFSIVIYEPTNVPVPAPCLMYYHGGAFVMGAVSYFLKKACYFAKNINCKVVFVHYRLAPKHPFPVPAEDCYTALLWVASHADELGIGPDRIAVYGESAGGALAAAVTQMARDRLGPSLIFQMLIYPVTDCAQDTESIREFTDTPGWNSHLTNQMWKLYLKKGDNGMLPYASPARATSFAGLPPAYIETEEFDCLRDEGNNYARKLQSSGVEVTLNQLRGTFHGFDSLGTNGLVKQVLADRASILKAHLSRKIA
jgi:acetyl esterase/lipase